MNFHQKITTATHQNNSLVCLGLDSDISKLPEHLEGPDRVFEFNKAIIDATHDLVCAYKPNSAFYEASGDVGLLQLQKTCQYIKATAPHVPIILDCKRADIGNTNTGYVSYAFDYLGADAVTVSPYMGSESLGPFLQLKDKGIIILCRTSNPGAGEFQDYVIDGGKKLFHIVAEHVRDSWNTLDNCSLVVGATYPKELADIRAIVGDDMLLLVPGVGAQGGELEQTVKAGTNSLGEGIMINSSRGIIFASSGRDFAAVARNETLQLRDSINLYR